MTKRKLPKLAVLDLSAVRGGEDKPKTPPQTYLIIKINDVIITSTTHGS